MRRVLVDTNIYVAFKRGNNSVAKAFKNVDFIGIDITVLAELYAGFAGGNRNSRNREELESFLRSPRVIICNHDTSTAEFYANIIFSLRRKGRPIPTNDVWIAATAMKMGLALYTFDTHFAEIGGLLLR